MRNVRLGAIGVGIAFGAFAMTMFSAREAAACGGCFTPPAQVASDITDERMLLSVSTTQSTLYDQISYSGDPASFAWVLPIHGTVDVGLSADVLFDAIDTLTATQIEQPVPDCPGLPSSCQGEGADAGAVFNAAGAAGGTVTVTKSQNVGPYETVQLHATDSSALNNWLTTNGFSIPADVTAVIDAYVGEGFDFLAMKLLPDAGVASMRPVRVTSPGASLSLPLRMAAIGTGASVGITIWTVADGRYEPQNFPSFHIDDKDLIWDFSTNLSNYTTLRTQDEANLQGRGWEIESSISLNQSLITNVIDSGGVYYGGGGVGGAPTASASDDYLPIGDPDAGTDDDGGVNETADQVRNDDIAALFAGLTGANVRVTRMRSDIVHGAMTTDFVLQASADQSELSNIRYVSQQVNTRCPIYNNCEVVGYGTPAQANAAIANGNAGGGGCITAARTEADGGVSALFGILGLVLVRRLNRRKNGKP